MFQEYRLVDFAAKYQPGYRNNVVPVTEVPSLMHKYKGLDCFTTYFLFRGNIIDHMKKNLKNGKPSISGYDGKVWSYFLPIDIDSADLKEALQAAQEVGGLVHRKWGVPEHGCNIHFSGDKGFHFMILSALFGCKEPSEDLHLVFSKVREGIAEELGVGKSCIDMSVKDRVRLLRLPNSQHGRSKLYKIQLRYDELLKLDVSDIKEKAKKPGMLWNTDKTGLIPQKPIGVNKYAAELYESALDQVERMKSRSSPPDIAQIAEYKQRSGKLFCKAREKMWYTQIPEGLRNNCCVRLAAELRLSGLSYSQALDMISFWNQNNEIALPADELTGILRNVYSSKRFYDFGCRDEIIQTFCPFEDKSRCQHYREYKRLASGNLVSKA
jgi:hypothetical protein